MFKHVDSLELVAGVPIGLSMNNDDLHIAPFSASASLDMYMYLQTSFRLTLLRNVVTVKNTAHDSHHFYTCCPYCSDTVCLDKQVIQYTTCPLLAFLDGCAPQPELDLGTGNSSATGSSGTPLHPSPNAGNSVEAELPSDLLDTSLESQRPARSSLIRLEPLTEAEASEETLFYLCELSPTGPDADSTQLDRV